jgi:hypothetical protein
MVETIIVGLVIIVLAAFVKDLWIHRNQPYRMLGGYPSSFLRRVRSKLKKKETEEEKKNREYWEEMSSEDPDKWKPLN